ncbi:hypothetical protein KZ850_02355, partial [Pseudomonas aeruginosa]|nr:hypothetical protein [Pseudomonas aeruginosa]
VFILFLDFLIFVVLFFFFFKQKTAYDFSECLVGSEMCIRDSWFSVRGPQALASPMLSRSPTLRPARR